MCDILTFPNKADRKARKASQSGELITARLWVHMCPKSPEINGKPGLKRIQCYIDVKCPFCGKHPE